MSNEDLISNLIFPYYKDNIVRGINPDTGIVEIEARYLPTYKKGEILKVNGVKFGKIMKVNDNDGTYDIKLNRDNLLRRLTSASIDDEIDEEEERTKQLDILMREEIDKFLMYHHNKGKKSKKKKPKGKSRGRSTKKVKKAKKSKKSKKAKAKKSKKKKIIGSKRRRKSKRKKKKRKAGRIPRRRTPTIKPEEDPDPALRRPDNEDLGQVGTRLQGIARDNSDFASDIASNSDSDLDGGKKQ